MPVSDTLADPVAEPNTWKATVLDPWVDDVSIAIAALEAGGGAGLFADLTQTVEPGLSSNAALCTANAALIQAAIDDGGIAVLAQGDIPSDPLLMRDGAGLWGQGSNVTILTLADGADDSIVTTENFTANVAAGTSIGTVNWHLRGIRLEGNSGSQSGTSSGLVAYGANWFLDDVIIHNCLTNCLRAEAHEPVAFPFTPGGRVSRVHNSKFQTAGASTVIWNGPSDSMWTNCEIAEANELGLGNTTSYALHVKANGSATQFHSCHVHTDNVVWAVRVDVDSAYQFHGQQEGGSTGVVWLLGSNSVISGRVFYHTGAARKGVRLGDAGGSAFASRNILNFTAANLQSGAVDFDGDGGNSLVFVSGQQASGVLYAGSPASSTIAMMSSLSGSTQLSLMRLPGSLNLSSGATRDAPLDPASSSEIALSQTIVNLNPTADRTGLQLPAGTLENIHVLVNVAATFSLQFAGAEFADGLPRTLLPGDMMLLWHDYAWYASIIPQSQGRTTPVTTTYTATPADGVILADATGGAFTVTLRPAAAAPYKELTIKRISASNNVTIDGNASETIDGATTKTLTTQWASITLKSDGTNWFITSQMGTVT